MGGECEKLLKNLGEQLAKDKDYSDVMMGLRTMLSFQVLKANVLCVRGQGDHGLSGPTSSNVPTTAIAIANVISKEGGVKQATIK